jgi:hypothetical protein
MGMKKHFDVEPTLTNATYLTTVTHATVGYGDITPKTPVAKLVVSAHIFYTWILVAMAASWSFSQTTHTITSKLVV